MSWREFCHLPLRWKDGPFLPPLYRFFRLKAEATLDWC
jgi:hypothetical protein